MKTTQCEKIIAYMQSHGGITQLDAYLDIGCWRLASRINDLKKQGYAIKRETIKVQNRYGESVAVARYSLQDTEKIKFS